MQERSKLYRLRPGQATKRVPGLKPPRCYTGPESETSWAEAGSVSGLWPGCEAAKQELQVREQKDKPAAVITCFATIHFCALQIHTVNLTHLIRNLH